MKLWKNSDTYYPRGLGLKKEVLQDLGNDYHSEIVRKIREQDYCLQGQGVTVFLAREFGFCYGVDRAVDYAYETCKKFPNRRIFLANEIIHNPHVNQRLETMGVHLLPPNDNPEEKLKDIRAQDVVLISAFGSPVREMELLHARKCIVVDTTCGSVMSVWKSVEKYAQDGFTAIIHGKYEHEETKATCSRVLQYPNAHYLVIRDMDEAKYVCDYIVHGGDKQVFAQKFVHSVSLGFDPQRHLQHMGLANQTTMLSSESLKIGEMLCVAIEKRYGQNSAAARFRTFDTICSATQDRQDAVRELLKKQLNLMLVLGGYNSSNTNHLAEISAEHVVTYHINAPQCLLSAHSIRYKPVGREMETTAQNWLPAKPMMIGVTAGASTPDREVGEVIERILSYG